MTKTALGALRAVAAKQEIIVEIRIEFAERYGEAVSMLFHTLGIAAARITIFEMVQSWGTDEEKVRKSFVIYTREELLEQMGLLTFSNLVTIKQTDRIYEGYVRSLPSLQDVARAVRSAQIPDETAANYRFERCGNHGHFLSSSGPSRTIDSFESACSAVCKAVDSKKILSAAAGIVLLKQALSTGLLIAKPPRSMDTELIYRGLIKVGPGNRAGQYTPA